MLWRKRRPSEVSNPLDPVLRRLWGFGKAACAQLTTAKTQVPAIRHNGTHASLLRFNFPIFGAAPSRIRKIRGNGIGFWLKDKGKFFLLRSAKVKRLTRTALSFGIAHRECADRDRIVETVNLQHRGQRFAGLPGCATARGLASSGAGG